MFITNVFVEICIMTSNDVCGVDILFKFILIYSQVFMRDCYKLGVMLTVVFVDSHALL